MVRREDAVIPRRLVVGQHLFERAPPNPVRRYRGALAEGSSQYLTPNLSPLLHVAVHSCASL